MATVIGKLLESFNKDKTNYQVTKPFILNNFDGVHPATPDEISKTCAVSLDKVQDMRRAGKEAEQIPPVIIDKGEFVRFSSYGEYKDSYGNILTGKSVEELAQRGYLA